VTAPTIVRPAPAVIRNGMPERKPYVYRGTGVDVLTPHLDLGEIPDDLRQCYCGGDMRGYRQHLADGEEPCRESREYVNAYHRERKRLESKSRCTACGYRMFSQNCRAVCGGAS
jgi:hypothetical protein